MTERTIDGRGGNRQYRPHEALEAFAADTDMLADAINGSTALLAALAAKRGPDRFLWRERPGAPNWQANQKSMTSNFMVHRVSLIEAREAHAESLRVARDPCFRCGTRGDVGCQHRRCA